MAEIDNDVAEYSQCLAGTENDFNHILSTFVDSEHEIKNFCDSRYIELSDIKSVIKKHGKEFTVLTLNIQSINAKFDNLYPVINNLSSMGLYFGAIFSRRHGFYLMPMFHCYISPAISWFTRTASPLGTAGWSYTYTKNIHISFEICIPNLISGRVYSSMSQVKIFAGLLLSATFTNHHTTKTIVPISRDLSKRFRP